MTDDTAVDDSAEDSSEGDGSSEPSGGASAEEAGAEQDSASSSDEDDSSGGGEDSSDEEKLEALGEHIRQARSRAEDNVEGVAQDEPSGAAGTGGDSGAGEERTEEFHESGETKSEDDQTIAPPG